MSEVEIGPFRVRLKPRAIGNIKVFGRRVRSSMKLTIEKDGSIAVAVPNRTPFSQVSEFVLANKDWIERERTKVQQRAERNPPKKFVAGEKLLFFGIERELVLEASPNKTYQVELVENFLVVHVPTERDFDAREIQSAIAKFAERQARIHLQERLAHWSLRMDLKPSGASFRRQKTRWGSCSSEGHISLNWKMIIAPEEVIDYVVIHELAHLKQANHSSRFWELVEKFDPEYQRHRRWLRDHQTETDFLADT